MDDRKHEPVHEAGHDPKKVPPAMDDGAPGDHAPPGNLDEKHGAPGDNAPEGINPPHVKHGASGDHALTGNPPLHARHGSTGGSDPGMHGSQ